MSNSSVGKLLLVASGVSTLGTCLTWTGLPVLLMSQTQNPEAGAYLFITQTVFSLLLGLFGGSLADRFRPKMICALNGLVNFVGFLLLFFYFDRLGTNALFVAGALNSLLGAIASSSFTRWYNLKLGGSLQQLEKGIAKRQAVLMASKLIGMPLGPIIYGALGPVALIVDGLTSLAEALIILNLPDADVAPATEKKQTFIADIRESWSGIRLVPGLSRYVGMSAVCSVMSFPLTSAVIVGLKGHFQAPDRAISAIWLIGAVGSLLMNSFLASPIRNRLPEALLIGIGSAVSFSALLWMGHSQQTWIYIALFVGVTLSNPVFGNITNAGLFARAPQQMKGRTIALSNTINDLSILLTMFIADRAVAFGDYKTPFYLFSAFALLRGALLYRLRGSNAG